MKNVEDIYPLSPMQGVMLLHSVSHGADDTLFNQFCYRIDTEIDVDAFRQAWQQVLDRHPALRTGFVWEKVRKPVQVVRESLSLPLELLDWPALSNQQFEVDLAALLGQDRQIGFDPRRPPLLRMTLIRRSDRDWRFVWSSHHLLLDRWCLGTVFADFSRYYSAYSANVAFETEPAPAFRDYIAWIQHQDPVRAEAYWRGVLQDMDHGTLIASDRSSGRREDSSHELRLDATRVETVRRFARERGVTLSTVVQAAWSLTLNHLSGSQDVVFGAAVSGRPPEVVNVESIVGSFVNNLPVRVQLDADQTLFALLKTMQTAQHRRSPFEYVSPVDIHSYSDLPHGEPLFDSLLVWLASDDSDGSGPLRMRGVSGDFTTAWPFTLSVAETAAGIGLHATQKGASTVAVRDVLRHLQATLFALAGSGESTTVGSLAGFRHEAGFEQVNTEPVLSTVRRDQSADERAATTVQTGREDVGAAMLRDFLGAEWQQVLAIDEVSPEDDFFALGGDSLRAAQLHARLEAGLRKTIPILTLFQNPTLRRMAQTLSRPDLAAKAGIAMALRDRGHDRPLFCIASPEVNTIGYSMLLRHLDSTQRVYVLQAPPDSDQLRQLHPDELPTLAAHYVKAMREIQPTGPYDLLGMCGGAHIAVEMTRGLEAEGRHSSFLGIVNTWGLYTISRRYHLHRLKNISRYYARRMRGLLPLPAWPEPAPANGSRPGDVQPVMPADGQAGADNPWIRDVGFAHNDPKRPRISATITVFRIKPQQNWRIDDNGLGWSKQSADVRIVHLAGDDHNAILREPYVREIAARIGQSLKHCLPQEPTGYQAATMSQTRSAL